FLRSNSPCCRSISRPVAELCFREGRGQGLRFNGSCCNRFRFRWLHRTGSYKLLSFWHGEELGGICNPLHRSPRQVLPNESFLDKWEVGIGHLGVCFPATRSADSIQNSIAEPGEGLRIPPVLGTIIAVNIVAYVLANESAKHIPRFACFRIGL